CPGVQGRGGHGQLARDDYGLRRRAALARRPARDVHRTAHRRDVGRIPLDDTARDADGGAHEHGTEVRRAALALLIVAAACNGHRRPASWRTVSAAQETRGEHALTVNVQYGAGRFHLTPGTG